MIVVIGRHVLVRDCLARGLGTVGREPVAPCFASVAAWLETGSQWAPALFVLCRIDGGACDLTGDRDVALLKREMPAVPFVIVADTDQLDDVVAALDSGARGYIPTSVSLDVAIEAIRLVSAGGTFVPASTLTSLTAAGAPLAAPSRPFDGLFTGRQIAVLDALRQGKANKQIARELDMREGMVKAHVRHIMKKLNARNRTEVAVLTSGLPAMPPSSRHGAR